MNFRKILMKITGILAGLLVLVLIGLTVYQSHLVKKSNREASMGGETVEDKGTDVADETFDTSREERLADREGQEAIKRQRMEFQRKMLEDPDIRESIRSGLEVQYEPLFEMLSLTPEQQETLKEILTNSAMAYIELNPEVIAAVTDEEKVNLQRRYDTLRNETQMRAEVILGHDSYEKYQAYEERSMARSVVSGFAESLVSGEKLTEKKAHELIEIMYGEAQNVYEDIGYNPTNRLEFPSDMDLETISEKMEITNRVLFNSADNSWHVLSESQLKAYNDYLRGYSEQVEMSLMMMGRQYGE